VLPKVTIAVLSWERCFYLKATLQSALACIEYPNIEWIVSDNDSKERGLREFIEDLSWVDIKIFKRQTHAAAMNQIVSLARGDFLLLWPDDVQFVVKGDWLIDFVEILDKNPNIGSMALDFQRKSTLTYRLRPNLRQSIIRSVHDIKSFGHIRRSRICSSTRGEKVVTYGSAIEGICGSGIPSLIRTSLWRKMGPWRVIADHSRRLVDSSLGAEDDMVSRFYKNHIPLQMATPLRPVAADIITDPLGCKAKVRGHKRYGVYMPPPGGKFYYLIRKMSDIPVSKDDFPVDFSMGVEPIGFQVPTDENGDRLKFSINRSVVFDLKSEKEIPYPLRLDER